MENTPTKPKALLNNDLPQEPNSPMPHKIKPIFKSTASWRCITPSDLSYINRYKPKMLSNITLSKISSSKIGEGGFRHLRRALIDCKRVSSLRFYSEDLDAKQIARLLHSTNDLKEFSFPHNSPQKFSRALSKLGRCKNLESFSICPRFKVDAMSWYLEAKLRRHIDRQCKQLNKLKSLSLHAPFFDGDILFNSHPPKLLQHIHISFISKTSFREQELSGFLSSIQKCSHLEHLSLRFTMEGNIEASEVQIWTSFFQNAPSSLKKLTLVIGYDLQYQSEITLSFIASLECLKDLTSLDITPVFLAYPYTFPDPSDELYYSLFISLQPLSQLKVLKFFPNDLSVLTSKSIKQLTLLLQGLKNLKSLEIDLPRLHSPNEGFISISESLKDLVHLKRLHLRFNETNPSQESMQIFFNNIAHLHLTSLAVSDQNSARRNSPVTSTIKSGVKKLVSIWKTPTIAPFFSNIGKFVLLSNLDLLLSDFKISTQEWKYLSGQLKQLKELSSLTLVLPKFDSTNNFEGLRNLFSCLQDLPKLVTLNLVFNKKICDQEINFLASHLIGCQNLKALTLEFRKPLQLGDQSLYFLRYGIRALLSLECLIIHFLAPLRRTDLGKKPFGEKAGSEFLEELSVLKNLETLSLYENFPYHQDNIPRPLNPKKYHNLRRLWDFSVNGSEFF